MKRSHLIVMLAAVIIGIGIGALIQRNIGFGNILYALKDSQKQSENPTIVIPEQFQGKLNLIILAGQSNMSGRGDIPSESNVTNSNIFTFGNDYRWHLAMDPVDSPINQVDKVSEDAKAGFGPAIPFSTSVINKHPDIAIGLVPCARSGSTIDDWERNLSDDSLYGSCLKRVRAASLMGDVAGLLFFQGEADALDPGQYPNLTLSANQWDAKFGVFVSDWRRDLGLPELPVVFAQIGSTTSQEYINWTMVQDRQESVNIPFVAMITTSDLTLKDEDHFDTESYEIIGFRFAEAFLELQR